MATLVKFYVEGEARILAVFPQLFDFNGYRKNNTCYSHIGQHSVSNKDYHSKLRLATKDEYLPLLEELQSIGYNLTVLNKK